MTNPELEPRTWYARVCCPICYGPVRVRPHEKEGRCRGCRPKRQHSKPKPIGQSRWGDFLNEHRAANR